MTVLESLIGSESNRWSIGAGVFLAVGFVLTGYGSYMNPTIAAQLRAGECDACAPWHPLFVLPPLVIGVAIFLVAGYLRFRR